MMRPIVLDASAAVPLVHREAESAAWRAIADRWLVDRRRVVVPSHFWLELLNSLMRRHRYTGQSAIEALHTLSEVVQESIEIDRSLLLLALDRVERFGLTAYDAAYLALAETLDAELATMDGALAAAAGDRLVRRPGPRWLADGSTEYGDPPRVTWPEYADAGAYLARLRAEAVSARRSL